ncbi:MULTISPECIES: nicotinate-nucleotide--dimethylbenzimidazole phosphoribosyltransferase [unclassified Siphonobacter]|uniref:nicotinate-nucleotide--dimethylbenzimidazole phosphoribosyltransferase n=1 Tax=unclassified Siphonobacter TaxID=2635712 RepID=UPI000CAC9CA1|nr:MULTISPECIES: nicotinate-nucleotide--dimethylbenzimidazole phosphoribosyltransferase [unclassified Siphonobacter]MDQ1085874.1 nicotinate-nucleotide--dimethylbenzimidazole phosphoribosyltransferase [Siphonobacter sp. SORGH_AS_1065]PKK38180.1 nicotinate-nucleotide--dimethylbenzimidazole phosphoribosyltransferase [Siphonobacter sp. SORGH_AS_0500]
MSFEERVQYKIDHKTKPLGALGQLETLAFRMACIQQTETPELRKAALVVFAADHGIAQEGVSAYPAEVTYQMVLNFLAGGAAINVFCRQNELELYVVDAGVNAEFSEETQLIHAKAGYGTNSYLKGPAMSSEQLRFCLEKGAMIVNELHDKGSNVIGFGEMGIGNTSSSSVLMSMATGLPIESCVGKGTGVNPEQLQRKVTVLKEAIRVNGSCSDPYQMLQTYGGFEIAQMVGAIRAARSRKMIILVDGFISTVALLIASQMQPDVLENAIYCHQSAEQGHRLLLDFLRAEPLLRMNLRLGEGTGCALAYPLLKSAVAFLNQMSTFNEAGISSHKNDT